MESFGFLFCFALSKQDFSVALELVLELDQAELEHTEFCLPVAGFKGVCHHRLAQMEGLATSYLSLKDFKNNVIYYFYPCGTVLKGVLCW